MRTDKAFIRGWPTPFWWERDCRNGTGRAIATALAPVATVYGAVAVRRLRAAPAYTSRLPVVCVGNFTAGGVGKTPLVSALCEHWRKMGRRPVILTRGYGGRNVGPHVVDHERDTAAEVGDEALLHAASTPVVVSRDRAAGARFIEAHTKLGAGLIVMDDGLQNRSLAKTFSIAAVDRKRMLGNGRVIPAGPLRAPIAEQAALTKLLVLVTPPDARDDELDSPLPNSLVDIPYKLAIGIAPAGDLDWLAGAQVLAYAGIGAPERFFRLLERLGAKVVESTAFADHHVFSDGDAGCLLRRCEDLGCTLVTTEKDAARLAGASGRLAELRARSRSVPIRAVLDQTAVAVIDYLLNGQ